MIPFKIYALAGAALAIGLLLWHDHHETHRANAAVARVSSVTAELAAVRDNQRKANEADQRNTTRQDDLQTAKAASPLPAVIVYRGVRQCPAVPQSTATAVPNEAAQADDAGAHEDHSGGIDIGPPLDQFATDAESNLIQCEELQRWVLGR